MVVALWSAVVDGEATRYCSLLRSRRAGGADNSKIIDLSIDLEIQMAACACEGHQPGRYDRLSRSVCCATRRALSNEI